MSSTPDSSWVSSSAGDAQPRPTLSRGGSPDVPEGQKLTTPERQAADTAEPQTVAGYLIEEQLGRGGMGVVYRAWHRELNRVVALKMILAGAQASEGELRRFLDEA